MWHMIYVRLRFLQMVQLEFEPFICTKNLNIRPLLAEPFKGSDNRRLRDDSASVFVCVHTSMR